MSFLSVLWFHVGEMKGKKLIPCLTQWSFHNPASYLAAPSEPTHPFGPLILLSAFNQRPSYLSRLPPLNLCLVPSKPRKRCATSLLINDRQYWMYDSCLPNAIRQDKHGRGRYQPTTQSALVKANSDVFHVHFSLLEEMLITFWERGDGHCNHWWRRTEGRNWAKIRKSCWDTDSYICIVTAQPHDDRQIK